MVAKITVPGSIRRALHYNEQKVAQGKAVCLLASGFLQKEAELNLSEKLARFERLLQLNRRATTNTVHISLNFAPGENLPAATLREIASAYMEKIGFAAQPFLVYQHHDAGHPHLHIVTTNIQRDGKRISLHNLGRGASEKARKELEVQFHLARAGEKKNRLRRSAETLPTQKAVYGKLPTQQAITNVLHGVLPHYNYASLPELNAILGRYHVLADRGAENSVRYQSGGLVYRILDEKGNTVGIPVKASALSNKATLPFLEKRFAENAVRKEPHKKQLQSAINWVLLRPPKSFAALEKDLQKENVSLVIRTNAQGFVYGLTYIDHRSKCVFNGSDLGKSYSAKGIMETCGITQAPGEENSRERKVVHRLPPSHATKTEGKWNKGVALEILEELLRPEAQFENLPFECKKQKKKRRKL